MPFHRFPSPLILRKNNNDDQNTFFHLILDPSDKVGNVCIDARCGLGMDNFRRKKVHRICWLSKQSIRLAKLAFFTLSQLFSVSLLLTNPIKVWLLPESKTESGPPLSPCVLFLHYRLFLSVCAPHKWQSVYFQHRVRSSCWRFGLKIPIDIFHLPLRSPKKCVSLSNVSDNYIHHRVPQKVGLVRNQLWQISLLTLEIQ